jgi:hypothetical protein
MVFQRLITKKTITCGLRKKKTLDMSLVFLDLHDSLFKQNTYLN